MVAVAALEYDAELMLRVKEGDGASFGLLLEKYRLPVIHFLWRMVQNHGISERRSRMKFGAWSVLCRISRERPFDAQVRGDGIFADRVGFELFGIGGEVAVVPRV